MLKIVNTVTKVIVKEFRLLGDAIMYFAEHPELSRTEHGIIDNTEDFIVTNINESVFPASDKLCSDVVEIRRDGFIDEQITWFKK